MTTWQKTVPIMPARDIDATAAFYRDRLDFDIIRTAHDYGIVRHGAVEIHLWAPAAPQRTPARRTLGHPRVRHP